MSKILSRYLESLSFDYDESMTHPTSTEIDFDPNLMEDNAHQYSLSNDNNVTLPNTNISMNNVQLEKTKFKKNLKKKKRN